MSMSMTTFIEWHVEYYDHCCFRMCALGLVPMPRAHGGVFAGLPAMCMLFRYHGIRMRAEFCMVQVMLRETGLLPRGNLVSRVHNDSHCQLSYASRQALANTKATT